jgi:hypothetical protein
MEPENHQLKEEKINLIEEDLDAIPEQKVRRLSIDPFPFVTSIDFIIKTCTTSLSKAVLNLFLN